MVSPSYLISNEDFTGTYTTASTSTAVWSDWNTIYTATAATATSTFIEDYADQWTGWNKRYQVKFTIDTSSSSDVTYAIWSGWNGSYRQYWKAPAPVQLTAEQIAQRAEEERQRIIQREAQAAQARQEQLAADQRAETLLKQSLSREQLREYESYAYFTVISADGSRRYRIKKGWSHNVERVDENGQLLHSLCAHPSEMVPEHDNMLAQKLMLEHSEEEFLRIANRGAERRAA